MTGVEKLFIYWRGGIIWDRRGNFSKLIDRGSHQSAFHRGTWTGCSLCSFYFVLCSAKTPWKVWKYEISNLFLSCKCVNILNRYHDQYLLKFLTVSFCFLTFVVYIVIVKFIIYSILACNFYLGNCTDFSFCSEINEMLMLTLPYPFIKSSFHEIFAKST